MEKNTDPTLNSLAKQLNISVSTISRVLNGKAEKYRISKATADLIIETAKEYNYTPNQLARGLRLKKTHTLGYIIPDIANPFFARIAQSIEKSAREQGYSVILCDSEEDSNLEAASVQILMDRKIDGLIISPVAKDFHYVAKLKKRDIPVVFIDRYFPDLGISFVTTENYRGALEGVRYLIDNGHRRIACIQGLTNTLPNTERIRGFKDAHSQNNIALDESLIVGNRFSELNGYIETKLLIKRQQLPTAIFCVSNQICFGVLKALKEEGLSVPNDISVITFDDQHYLSYLSTPITAIKQERSQIGHIAIKLLLDQIESGNNTEPKGIFLPTRLIIRDSVKKITENNL